MRKPLNNLRIEGNFTMLKGIYIHLQLKLKLMIKYWHFPPNTKNNAGMHSLTHFIQHWTRSHSQGNGEQKGWYKWHDDWEGKHKIIFTHRQHHCLPRISSGIFKIIAELSLFNNFSGYKLNILKSTVFFLDQEAILENKILIFHFW